MTPVIEASATAPTPAPIILHDIAPTFPATLQQRLAATSKWLEDVADDHYSVQLSLIETRAPEKTERYLRRVAAQVGVENIHVYKAVINGKPVYSVLYSDYPNREMAILALLALPEKLRADGAFVRPLKGVRGDITNQAAGELKNKQVQMNDK